MFQSTISMLRVSDARASEALYCGKMGFRKTWEYDPGDGSPVFIEVSRDAVSFHLSEHDGDGPFGIQLYVNVTDAVALHGELTAQGLDVGDQPYEAPWGHMVFETTDPDGNTLRFGSPTG